MPLAWPGTPVSPFLLRLSSDSPVFFSRTHLCCFLLPWMPQVSPLLPQQSGSDPLRDSHIYPATSQHEEQGLTKLQGPVPAAPL